MPLGLLAFSACGDLQIGSYGSFADARAAGAGGGAGGRFIGGGGESNAGANASGSGGAGGAGGAGGSGSTGSAGIAGADHAAGGDSAEGEGGGGLGSEGGSGVNGGAGASSGGLTSVDIGDTGAPGTTVFADGAYTIEASGADIEGRADSFRFAHECLAGDGQVVARIEEIASDHPWTKAGVMIRDSLAPGARYAFLLLRPSQGSAFQHRPGSASSTESTWEEAPEDLSAKHRVRYLKPPKWLKLTRQGHVFTAYSSDDGKCWWRRYEQSIGFEDAEACFGVALTAASYGDLVTAHVTNVAVSSTIEPDNLECPRARADGDLALPPPEGWIVPPARFGASEWDYTTDNPNGTTPGTKCDPWADDVPPSWIVPRSDGPDHPNCPDQVASPAWTRLVYDYGNTWESSRVGIGAPPGLAGDTLTTHVEARGLWLRKKFSLEPGQETGLMLWGRWADGITVYVNGVLATWNSSGTAEYRYLGLSDEARAALVVGGENVLAVRLEWDRWDFWEQGGVIESAAWDRFFDLGLTINDALAALPVERRGELNAGVATYVDTVKEFLQEQGISGATFAIAKNGAIVSSAGLGWHDKNLAARMKLGAKLRLASNDEIITQALIAKLVNDGVITPGMPVFPRLGLAPVPDGTKGENVDQITVADLLDYRSGIGAIVHDQSMLDELAFRFGIRPDQWTSEYNARWLYSLDAGEVGQAPGSPRDAYFLLRFLAERVVAPRSLQEYLTEDMGLREVTVSHERLTGREPNEGYVTREPTWDRWAALENYLALSASAEGYASFLQDYPLDYELTQAGRYVAIDDGGGIVGAMPGTWSVALRDPTRGLGIVMIANSHGNFDEVIARLDDITYRGSPCLFGNEDPRELLQNLHYVQSAGQPELYVNLEFGLLVSPAVAGNWSAQWRLEPVDDVHFRLRNRWTEQYLSLVNGLPEVGELEPGSLRFEWRLVPTDDAFQIQNHDGGDVLYVEDGRLLSSATASGPSAEWRFCN